MVKVMKFFEMTPGTFRTEWARLTDSDKAQLKAGVENGSFTY